MLFFGRRISALTLAMATFGLAACSNDDDPTENSVVLEGSDRGRSLPLVDELTPTGTDRAPAR